MSKEISRLTDMKVSKKAGLNLKTEREYWNFRNLSAWQPFQWKYIFKERDFLNAKTTSVFPKIDYEDDKKISFLLFMGHIKAKLI